MLSMTAFFLHIFLRAKAQGRKENTALIGERVDMHRCL